MHATAIAHRLRITRTRRLACALTTLAAVAAGTLGASAAPALAGACPNEQLRSENNSTRLPECRAYEKVTPQYMEGFPVEGTEGIADGALAYFSLGDFSGASAGGTFKSYVATRSAAGWTTTSLNPPAATYAMGNGGNEGLSADLRSSVWRAARREPPADDGGNYYLRGPDGSMTRFGPTVVPGSPEAGTHVAGASADLTHILIVHNNGGGSYGPLEEYVSTDTEGLPRPVSIDNTGASTPGKACAAGMSADGRVIVFTPGCDEGTPALSARVGGSATVAVSGSECTRTAGDPGGVCNALAPANPAGMATDGSRVYFTSTQQLVNGDTDQTNDLFECDIPPGTPAPVGIANPCSSLTEVSGNATGADVQSVVNVSADGSRVYFIAKGVLAPNLGTNDAAPVAGDENLYVWEKDAAHPAGQTTFVTKLESGIGFRPQTTADGRYLLFSTASRLVASDTDEAPHVYRYDAQTRTLLRLSTDTSGSGGNEPGVEATLFPERSAMSADGGTVVFDTAEALSPADTDGVTDVYDWHEGHVSLISNGGVTAFGTFGITPSGRDIFFETAQPLTSGDSGIEGDIYDARVGGGFPASTPAQCPGEACQGAPALQPQPPGTSASAAFNGPGSPPAAETPPANPKPKPQTAAQKLAKALKACRAKHNKKQRKACEKRARTTYRRAK